MTDKLTKNVGKRKPPPKGGSRKGIPNKITADIKAMILEALGNAGGAAYLEQRANDPRTAAAFLGLVGKVLPLTLAGDGTNAPVFVIRQVTTEQERAAAWQPPRSTS